MLFSFYLLFCFTLLCAYYPYFLSETYSFSYHPFMPFSLFFCLQFYLNTLYIFISNFHFFQYLFFSCIIYPFNFILSNNLLYILPLPCYLKIYLFILLLPFPYIAKKIDKISLVYFVCMRQCPTLPDRFQSSTISAEELNFCVRYVYR